jgi:DNA segregation ATPase FtsK/SpoIIIE, S-DNA-T family
MRRVQEHRASDRPGAERPTPGTRAGGPSEIRLTIRIGQADFDIDVRAAPWIMLGDVLDRLEPTIGTRVEGPVVIASERLGAWLDRSRPLSSLGLIDGDRIAVGSFPDVRRFVEEDANAAEGAVEIVIRGGPRTGERIPLPPGDHVVGRDPKAQVSVRGDPSLSSRHARLRVGPSSVAIEDLGSTNGTSIDGVAIERRRLRPVMAGQVIEVGRTAFTWKPAVAAPAPRPGRSMRVDRPPRIRRPWTPVELPFSVPADPIRRQRIPILASILPVLLGVVLWLMTGQVMMLFLSALGPVVAVASRAEDLGFGARSRRRELAATRERIRGLDGELGVALAAEVAARRQEAPDAGVLLRRAADLSPDLWLRRPDDDDVLEVRLGSADQPSRNRLVLADGGNATLRAEVETVAARHATATGVPVILPLARWGSVGLVGPAERVDGLARWIVLQAALLHPPSELRIHAAIGSVRLAGWEWLKWLPHVREASTDGSALASSAAAAATLLEGLVNRHPSNDRQPRATPPVVRELLIVDAALTQDARALSQLLRLDPSAGVAVVWLGEDERTLPADIRSIVRLDRAVARLDLVDVASATTISGATADGISRELAAETARGLAALRDPASEADVESALPTRVSLLEVGGQTLDPRAIERAWATPVPATVIGMSANGPLTLDLRRDGPHGLVGGTTGSGKSELLQAFVAGLALAAPPSRMSFLLVDYKGGAAFREAAELPHAAGLITDLDERLARRALVSLDAEIHRREAILDGLRAKTLDDAVALDPAAAPARLVIVVDEFATLAREVPEFVDGLVDVARRGRTLGVHLVLATQRPAGVVSREIWTNTDLRIALRVADAADSKDVIDIPDAAELPRTLPGRAFVRVGNGAPVLIQAAYVGGSRAGVGPDLVIRPFRFGGFGPEIPATDGDRAETVLGSRPGPEPGASGPTELAEIVAAVAAAHAELRLDPAASPWLPPLSPVVHLDDVAGSAESTADAPITFGLVDDPGHQRQIPMRLDLDRDGGLLVFGSGGTGRTTTLLTVVAALARSTPPSDLHVYGLDFGAGGLQAIESLPHCGAVINGADEERVTRVLGMLRTELARRQEARSGSAVAADARHPRLVLLLDGYAAFANAYEKVQFGELVELLPRLAADGRSVGIHLLITADRRGSLPSRLTTMFPRRLVLELSDEAEYGQFGLDRRAVASVRFGPGRGLVESGLEAQVAVAGADASPAAALAAMKALAASTAARWPGVRAPAIGTLPVRIGSAALPPATGPGRAVIGIGDRALEPVEISLEDGHFLVTGPLRSGRSTALGTIAASLAATTPDVELHLLLPRRSPLADRASWATVDQGVDACVARLEELAKTTASAAASSPWNVVVLDDGDELFEGAAAAPLLTLVRRGRDLPVRLIVAAEVRSTLKAYGGWIAELRKDRHGILLQPGQDVGGELLGATLPRAGARSLPPGRGYLVVRGGVELVQLAEP